LSYRYGHSRDWRASKNVPSDGSLERPTPAFAEDQRPVSSVRRFFNSSLSASQGNQPWDAESYVRNVCLPKLTTDSELPYAPSRKQMPQEDRLTMTSPPSPLEPLRSQRPCIRTRYSLGVTLILGLALIVVVIAAIASTDVLAQVPPHRPGTICFTPQFWCSAQPPGPVGSPCACPTPYGWVAGYRG